MISSLTSVLENYCVEFFSLSYHCLAKRNHSVTMLFNSFSVKVKCNSKIISKRKNIFLIQNIFLKITKIDNMAQ